jgi:hypothetical protein
MFAPNMAYGVQAKLGMVPAVMKSVLTGQVTFPEGELHLCDLRLQNAPAVTTALRERPDHPCDEICFCPPELGGFDVSALCVAAMGGRGLRALMFTDFSFDGASSTSPQLMTSPTTTEVSALEDGLAPLKEVTLLGCRFGPGAWAVFAGRTIQKLALDECNNGDLRVCDFAVSMCSQSRALQGPSLEGTLLEMCDMSRLCGMLTLADCAVVRLRLGGTTFEGDVSLSDEVMEHFFERLPSMESLLHLRMGDHAIPMHLSPTILAGSSRTMACLL